MSNDKHIDDFSAGTPTEPNARRRSLLLRLLKALGITVACVVGLTVILLSAIVYVLTPERLTPLIERVASEQMNARVEIDRAELTFWKTFPKLTIQIDGLRVVSKSLDSLTAETRATLPADADSLMSVRHFNGALNLLKIAGGEIALSDVDINGLDINLFQVNDSTSNFNIFPASAPDTTKSELPAITINHFAITDARRIRFQAPADSIDIALRLRTINLDDNGIPLYKLTLDTDINTPMLREMALDTLDVNLDAGIRWDPEAPSKIDLQDLRLKAGGIDVIINAMLNLSDNLTIEQLETTVNRLEISYLIEHLPSEMREKLKGLSTDMTLNVDARLDRPLELDDSLIIPPMTVTLNIPECYLRYDKAQFNRLAASLTAVVAGDGLNSASVDIDHIIINGRSVDLSIYGSVSSLFNDALFDGNISGSIDFDRLSPTVKRLLDYRLRGQLALDTRLRMRASDLTADNFHSLLLDGSSTLRNFRLTSRDSLTDVYARSTRLSFGSSNSVNDLEGNRVDSMLIIRLSIDTASVITPEIEARLSGFTAGFGSSNTSASADTTRINPFGGGISIKRLTYLSVADSTRLSIRRASGIAMLRRYKNEARIPLLNLDLQAGRLRANSPDFAASMRDSRFNIIAHLRPRRRTHKTYTQADSVADSDSLSTAPRRHRRPRAITREQLDSIGVDVMDFDVDNSLRSLLIRWNLEGSVTSASGRIRTSSYPIRQSYRNLNFVFTSDSIALSNLDYRLGTTSMSVTGAVSNIRRALSRRHPQPLKLDLQVVGDTVNINELVQAHVNGSKNKGENLLNENGDEQSWEERDIETVENALGYDSVTGPLLVPVNIDAGIKVSARDVVYSDMMLHNVSADLSIYRGSLKLENVKAYNEIGSVNLTALYSAPKLGDMRLGFGMMLSDFNIERLKNMMPALDSIVPLMRHLSGIIDANMAATVDIKPSMDLDVSSLKAAFRLRADNLAMTDNDAMRTLAKWLMFKNKEVTRIDSVSIDAIIRDGVLEIYPFELNIDRYRLGIMGYNDINMDLNYHVAVLKSPLPFRFGINIKGNADNPKIRFGGSKFKKGMVARRDTVADTVRINLISEISKAFRRGVRAARLGPLHIANDSVRTMVGTPDEAITAADSVLLIRAGILQNPDSTATTVPDQK